MTTLDVYRDITLPPPLPGPYFGGLTGTLQKYLFWTEIWVSRNKTLGSVWYHLGITLGALWDHFRDRAIGGKATWKLTGTLQNPYRDIAVDPAQDET